MRNREMTNYKRKKILMLVAGGTGGHIYPSLSLINKMKKHKFKFDYLNENEELFQFLI